jgi:hypothetical protein
VTVVVTLGDGARSEHPEPATIATQICVESVAGSTLAAGALGTARRQMRS